MSIFKHETAIVNENAAIGDGTRIWQFCTVMGKVTIGENCNIGAYVFIEDGVDIGSGVKVKNNVSLYTGVKLEDDSFIGPNVVFTNVMNPRSFISRKSEFRKSIVKRGASIGANATVVCGNTIGEYAFIGAGSVVTKDVPAHGMIIGNPGRLVGYVCYCGNKLQKKGNNLVCDICGRSYYKDKTGEIKEGNV